jgi:DNA-binding CsgD family transcriptional regulator
MGTPNVIPIGHQQAAFSGLSQVVDALGQQDFGRVLGRVLRDACGAEYITGFHVSDNRAALLTTAGVHHPDIAVEHASRYVEGEHWRRDPAVALADSHCTANSSLLVRVDPTSIGDPILQRDFYGRARVVDKLGIYARRERQLFGISLLHTAESGRFTESGVDEIAALADLLVALLAKHAALRSAGAQGKALASVEAIEQRLVDAAAFLGEWRLSRREREVCARILFGIAASGIAVDLGINEESVSTYRKRAYGRLGIATRHELMREYLSLCDSCLPRVQ